MKKRKINVLLVFGTRPEVIKMAPLVREFRRFPGHFNTKVCVTGQHRQMIDPLIKLFKMKVDYDLKIMQPNQTLENITSLVLEKMGTILDKEETDWVLVQGDTTTAMAAGLAAFYKKVKVAHVEAGLRTWDNENPYPEEVNRRIIDAFADVYFAHTPWAKKNLLNEGFDPNKIILTGNTVIDALLYSIKQKYDLKNIGLNPNDKRKLIVVTAHRRENIGEPIINICEAIKAMALKYKNKICFIYPVHLNPNIRKPVFEYLKDIENVVLTEPLEYLPFVHLIKKAHFLVTDSGGLQEEAPSLGKPVLVLRKTTERPEGIKAGCVKVTGTNKNKIIEEIQKLIVDPVHYKRMAHAKNPYGDGQASQRIVSWFKRNAV